MKKSEKNSLSLIEKKFATRFFSTYIEEKNINNMNEEKNKKKNVEEKKFLT